LSQALKEDSGREDSLQREHDLRAVFNAVRYVARTGGPGRYLPNDLPPWFVVYQQMQRWLLGSGAGARASRRRWSSTSAPYGPHRSPALEQATYSGYFRGWISC
jgi:transposase